MPSAACYTNKLRVAAQTKSRKVQFPGGMANATQSIRAACNIAMSYVPVTYVVQCPCDRFPPPFNKGCTTDEIIYTSDGAELFACTTLDGGGITTPDAIVYDAGVDCV